MDDQQIYNTVPSLVAASSIVNIPFFPMPPLSAASKNLQNNKLFDFTHSNTIQQDIRKNSTMISSLKEFTFNTILIVCPEL